MIIGEVRLLKDVFGMDSFVWDGEEFKHRFESSIAFRQYGDCIVKSEMFPWFKLEVRNFEYWIYLSGSLQVWLLEVRPLKFRPIKGRGRIWLFSKGVWKPDKECTSVYEKYVVSGEVPYWALLITFAGLCR